MKTALILGASGLTGSLLLDRLLSDDAYDTIKIFGRKTIGKSHPKLQEFLCDLLKLEEQAEQFTGNEVYCCIGTTVKKTPDKKIYHQIDFGIPVATAKLCVKNNIETIVIVSALGASAKSSIFYNRTKGEMQEAVAAEKIKNTFFMQPSFIGGNREEERAGEKIGIAIFKFVQPLLIGPLKKYRMILADSIAKAMIKVAKDGYDKQLIESDEIAVLGA
jgi:uncharacterized protein YbjT (DUF2867 family)